MDKKIIAPQMPKIAEVREIKNEKETKLETPIVEKKEEARASGQSQSISDEEQQMLTKVGIGTASAITGVFCPPAGGAIALSGGLTGKAIESIGKDSGNEDLQKVGEVIGTGTAVGGGVGKGVGKLGEKVAEETIKKAIEEGGKEAVEEALKNS